MTCQLPSRGASHAAIQCINRKVIPAVATDARNEKKATKKKRPALSLPAPVCNWRTAKSAQRMTAEIANTSQGCSKSANNFLLDGATISAATNTDAAMNHTFSGLCFGGNLA